MDKETILVTSALPYANGSIHFGHIAGAYLPADVFTRYHRLLKDDIVYICGTDEYGVAITIQSEKEGRTPKEHVDHYHQVIKSIFEKFNISFDHFSRTTTETHTKLSQQFFTELHKNGHIEEKVTQQLFSPKLDMFLADRYVEGQCYICDFENARGDECPSCGSWLEPLKLKNPKCKITGETPEIRTTKHWFLKLGDFKEKLHAWLDNHKKWKSNVISVVRKQIDELESRPITRDLKWGVPVPLEEAEGKALYVWFDAPIGYVDATMEWAKKEGTPERWRDYWQNPKTRIVNFIGKDNIPFHLLVWPSMLMGQTTPYTLAENVPANEFYNLEGRQFSKSDGWIIDLDRFFNSYSTDQIRYAIAANAPETKDSDFNWRDFQKFNNSDLANVLGNLVNRTLTFTKKNFDNKVPQIQNWPYQEKSKKLIEELRQRKQNLPKLFDNYQLRKAAYEVIDLARIGNNYFEKSKPWLMVKEDKEACGETLLTLIRLIEEIATCAWPIIPETSEKILSQLGLKESPIEKGWDFQSSLGKEEGHELGTLEILFEKIDDKVIQEEIELLEKSLNEKKKQEEKTPLEPISEEITFDDFVKVDLRVVKVLEAEEMKKSKKLLKLKVDLGMETRQVLAGIKEHYDPKDLIGKSVVLVANLKPRKMMGELSQGMILAASDEKGLKLVSANESSPGSRVQ